MSKRVGLSQTAAKTLVTRPPRLLLIAGATGVGKSTVSVGLAHRLGITRVLSTDAIREIMRVADEERLHPALHRSSFSRGDSGEPVTDWSATCLAVENGLKATMERAIIGESGTDVTDVVNSFTTETASPAAAVETPKKDTPTPTPPTAAATPSKPAASAPAPSAAKKVSAIQSENGRIIASPLAKALAQEKGINLAKVVGTGEGGRIIKTDVENFTDVIVADAPAFTVTAPVGEVSQTEVKNSQMRKAIVRALDNSQTTAVNFTIGMDINMDNAMASRKEINALPDTKVSFNDMVVKACAMALKKHPQINTEWTDDKTIYNNHISVGVAVAIEDGLVVPVIPFTDSTSLTEIGAEVKDKAIKAKNKKLSPAEMSGSTFTVSNLGMFGVTEFTSIINQPNSAILSVGGINQQPIVKDGQIVVGNIMKVTLACDHRTIDGAVGAAFLNTLKQYIENPVTMLA